MGGSFRRRPYVLGLFMKPGPPTDEQEPTEHQGEPVPGLRNEKLIGEDANPGIHQADRT